MSYIITKSGLTFGRNYNVSINDIRFESIKKALFSNRICLAETLFNLDINECFGPFNEKDEVRLGFIKKILFNFIYRFLLENLPWYSTLFVLKESLDNQLCTTSTIEYIYNYNYDLSLIKGGNRIILKLKDDANIYSIDILNVKDVKFEEYDRKLDSVLYEKKEDESNIRGAL